MQWYYLKGSAQNGPIEDDELKRLADAGQLLPSDLVWTASMGDKWAPASTVEGLFAEAPSAESNQPAPPPAGLPAEEAPLHTGEITHNRELMRLARESLAGRWGIAVGGFALYMLIGVGLSFVPFVGQVIGWVVAGPFSLGLCRLFLAIARRVETKPTQIFDGFKVFGTAFATYLLMMVFLLLWFLLLIIPGIIKSFSYAMTFFVLADTPSIGPLEAITRSRAIMNGRKWKLFCLHCRFIGWSILCVFTLGIGFFWLAPYMQTSMAHFYDDVNSAPLEQ